MSSQIPTEDKEISRRELALAVEAFGAQGKEIVDCPIDLSGMRKALTPQDYQAARTRNQHIREELTNA